MAMVSWDRDMSPKVSMTPSKHRGGENLADGEGELEDEIFQERSRSQLGPDQAVNLFEEIDDDEQGDKGHQAQPHELEELPGHIVFQDTGAEKGRRGHGYIYQKSVVFILFIPA